MDIMKKRTPSESLIDRLLLLYLIVRIRDFGYKITGNVKLQKLTYKSQERMFLGGLKGFNYNFVRWDFGPFSQEIVPDTSDLLETGFLRKSGNVIVPSGRGSQLIRDLDTVFERNKAIVEYIDRVILEFGPYPGKTIRALMYSYPKVGVRKTIEQTKKGELILSKLDASEAKETFWIDDEWMETLEMLFDPTCYKAVSEGLEALRKEEGRPFIPVTE